MGPGFEVVDGGGGVDVEPEYIELSVVSLSTLHVILITDFNVKRGKIIVYYYMFMFGSQNVPWLVPFLFSHGHILYLYLC